MLHQDRGFNSASAPNHQALKAALEWLIDSAVLSKFSFRGDCTWTPLLLISTAILWTWSDEKTLKERFFTARKIALHAWGWKKGCATSYQAFTKILRHWTNRIVSVLVDAFRKRMRTDLGLRFAIAGYVVFGVDGSRLELPRTESNQGKYSSGRKAKRKRSKRKRCARAQQKMGDNPQMWLTTLWHVGTGLPWDWRIGPSDSSEREHLQQMIDSLPPGALLTADAGFVGYEYWKEIIDGGRQLLIRVGSNVRLLKRLGYVREYEGLVYLWPNKVASKNKPPLALRLVVVHSGRHPLYLVTSIQKNKLADAQLARIYGLRWGIELFYRHFKQTFERRKLRSHSPANAEVEATWSLLGLWAMCLHAECELVRQKVPRCRMSVAGLLRAYRKPMREYKSLPDPDEDLYSLLHIAVIDEYERASKTSRDYPRKKKEQASGPPRMIKATRQQVKKAQEIQHRMKLGLTA